MPSYGILASVLLLIFSPIVMADPGDELEFVRISRGSTQTTLSGSTDGASWRVSKGGFSNQNSWLKSWGGEYSASYQDGFGTPANPMWFVNFDATIYKSLRIGNRLTVYAGVGVGAYYGQSSFVILPVSDFSGFTPILTAGAHFDLFKKKELRGGIYYGFRRLTNVAGSQYDTVEVGLILSDLPGAFRSSHR